MDPFWVFAIVCGLIILLLFIGAPLKPLRWIGQGVIKLVIGALLLFFLNAFGTAIDIHIPINIATASVTGFLGIPGLIALVAIHKIIL
ncbi:pro-sigmaK processing inhibitor BofA family protein [Pseudalkalibacillus salsuginis]|uniref:pro-sigmaK processing inhibitor BofA family protein n=1 Tax=Pseudalkalibacillus salsuginis TaxID=2910972 RepID=UPI001CD7E001|nr:pro-sigmaK processing inhibitor BofA family protein [Pseudalkalibacillus salsuginis]MCF6411980.1 pro-sigmaK processing inhibitor BofA family protein [Pseudalkalibacillus salsuginis]